MQFLVINTKVPNSEDTAIMILKIVLFDHPTALFWLRTLSPYIVIVDSIWVCLHLKWRYPRENCSVKFSEKKLMPQFWAPMIGPSPVRRRRLGLPCRCCPYLEQSAPTWNARGFYFRRRLKAFLFRRSFLPMIFTTTFIVSSLSDCHSCLFRTLNSVLFYLLILTYNLAWLATTQ